MGAWVEKIVKKIILNTYTNTEFRQRIFLNRINTSKYKYVSVKRDQFTDIITTSFSGLHFLTFLKSDDVFTTDDAIMTSEFVAMHDTKM